MTEEQPPIVWYTRPTKAPGIAHAFRGHFAPLSVCERQPNHDSLGPAHAADRHCKRCSRALGEIEVKAPNHPNTLDGSTDKAHAR